MTVFSQAKREPLVLFSLVAGVVFGVHAWATPNKVEVLEFSAVTISEAMENRQMLFGRSLSSAEQEDLISELVNQEVLVREAILRGFHLHDSKTRSRLVNQMHFVLTEDAPEPTPQDLADLKAQTPARYMSPKTVTFDHVFFETDQAAAQALSVRIKAGEKVLNGSGDKFWLGNRLERYSAPQLLTVLGHSFFTSLKELTPQIWSGPIRSGRGWHLVRLERFHPPEPLSAAEVDKLLRADWKAAFRRATFDVRLTEMRQNYEIVLPKIAPPSVEATEAKTAVSVGSE